MIRHPRGAFFMGRFLDRLIGQNASVFLGFRAKKTFPARLKIDPEFPHETVPDASRGFGIRAPAFRGGVFDTNIAQEEDFCYASI